MLKEISQETRKDRSRRWFADDYFGLIVWTGPDDGISGFQLCYGIQDDERALTWTREMGYSHERVDAGEENPTKNKTPILVPDGMFPAGEVLKQFLTRSTEIDPAISAFVSDKLRKYSG